MSGLSEQYIRLKLIMSVAERDRALLNLYKRVLELRCHIKKIIKESDDSS